MKSLQEKVAEQLNLLVGKALWASHRTVDLQSFDFGGHISVRNSKGSLSKVGEYALHIQCRWRICIKEKIVVGSTDRYYPKDKGAEIDLDFEWDKPGVNLCDFAMESFLNKKCPIIPKSIIVDEVGGFRLLLEHGFCLDVFPDDSQDGEHWRMFQPAEKTHHVVLRGNKLRGSLIIKK